MTSLPLEPVLTDLDADEALIGNANLLGVYVADVGAAAPTEETLDDGVWQTLGWISEDGVSISPDRSIEQLKAWQSASPIKTVLQEFTITVDLQLLQHNATTLSHYWGQTAPTADLDGSLTMDIDVTGNSAPQVALVVDTRDGDMIARYFFYQAQVISVGELSIQRGGFQALPVTFTALDPGTGVPATVYLLPVEAGSGSA